MNIGAFAVICGALAAAGLCAQQSYPVGTIYFHSKDYSGPPVAGAPFCGERRNVRTITQRDGTQKTEEYATFIICRDSAGRTRSAYPVYMNPGGPQIGPLLITISDPVVGAKYLLYEVNRTAYRQLQSVRTMHPPCRMPIPASEGVVGGVENLGTQTMEGLLVEGRSR